MRRWGVPLLVLGGLLVAGVIVALLPVKAEEHSCGASSFAIVSGAAEVPEELSHECHKQARTDMFVAAIPAAAGLVGAVITAGVLRGAKQE